MKIGLLGGYGQLGSELRRTASAAGHAVVAPTSTEVNLTRPATIREWVADTKADAWINAAAYTAVDAAEDNAQLAYAINRDGAKALTDALNDALSDAPEALASAVPPLLYLSTDYVFSGTKGSPYTETDPTDPQGVYGASKLAGEQASLGYANAIVLRISWVFGSSGHNFVRSILRAARRFARDGGALNVVDDQFGAPCGTPSIAGALLDLVGSPVPPGVYHFANSPHTNWFEFAKAIVEEAHSLGLLATPVAVHPQPTSALNQKAARPPDGRMDSGKLQQALGYTPMPWRSELRAVLTEWAALPEEELDG